MPDQVAFNQFYKLKIDIYKTKICPARSRMHIWQLTFVKAHVMVTELFARAFTDDLVGIELFSYMNS